MTTELEIKKVKEIVEELLSQELRCRNDDKWLTYKVLRKFTNIYIPFQDFEKMPSYETVSRVRRYIQNTEGKFPPTDPDVINKRQHRQEVFKQVMRS